jgi:hypothetical protein
MRTLIFIVVSFFIDGGKFQRVAGDDFEIGSTLIALDDFALFDVVHVDIQRIVTLRAYDCHRTLSCTSLCFLPSQDACKMLPEAQGQLP